MLLASGFHHVVNLARKGVFVKIFVGAPATVTTNGGSVISSHDRSSICFVSSFTVTSCVPGVCGGGGRKK